MGPRQTWCTVPSDLQACRPISLSPKIHLNRFVEVPMPTPNNQQNPAEIQRILAAAQFAAEKHAQQRRKGEAQEPYINHLIEVARLIADSSDQLDPELIMAGLLHDTVEDTGVTKEELAHKFGPDVASLVAEVTDDKTLPKE